MTNLRTDEIVFFLYLTKIGTDENKAIYSITVKFENDWAKTVVCIKFTRRSARNMYPSNQPYKNSCIIIPPPMIFKNG